MYYTYKVTYNTKLSMSFTDFYNNFDKIIANQTKEYIPNNNTRTETIFDIQTIDRLKNNYDILGMVNTLHTLSEKADSIKALHTNLHELYTEFKIPKKSGGYRTIQAPTPILMDFLREVKTVFENKLHTLAHDRAYAYVKGRSTKDALKIHQQYNSRWFLKLDVKDFFPSCNKQFILNQLAQIFPFQAIFTYTAGVTAMSKILDLCLLDDKLPQGTPMSPLLTNLIMLPIDHEIFREVRGLTYTRYADDILLSKTHTFNWIEAEKQVNEIFKKFNAPFKIKKEKTRYGSSAGRNWNLGLMLNKDNKITTGHKQKQRLKAAIFSFLSDLTNGITWDKIDVQILMGHINYFKQIEPAYITHILEKYNSKFNKNIIDEFINIIKKA